MNDPKPRIKDSDIDHILEQVQEKRARSGTADTRTASDSELNAILAELGIETAPRRASVEPVLLPEPEYLRGGSQNPAPDASAPGAPEEETGAPKKPSQASGPAGQQTEKTPREPKTRELPELKSYSEAEARRQAEEKARIYEQARREAEQAAQEARAEKAVQSARTPKTAQKAKTGPGKSAQARRVAAQDDAHVHTRSAQPEADGEGPQEENRSWRTLTNIKSDTHTGEMDERFRDFFAKPVIDDPTENGRRKREKSGFLAKLFSRRTEETDDGGEEAGEYYESESAEGYTGEFEKLPDVIESIRAAEKSKARGETSAAQNSGADAAGRERRASFSASVVAHAITGSDSFDFGTKTGRRGAYAVDVDIPLADDAQRSAGQENTLTGEGTLEEYSRLSDAPAVSAELSRIRETRLVRTFFTGALALMLIYLGLSAREGGLPAIPALDPHKAPFVYLLTNLLLLAAAAFSSLATLGTGLTGLVKTPTADSFAALATVAAAAQNGVLLALSGSFDPEKTTLFAPAAALLLCGNALGKWLQLRAVCANFNLASSGDEHEATFLLDREKLAKRLCKGMGAEEPRVLLNRPTALVKGFLRQSFSAHRQDALAQRLCWALGGAALLCAVVCGVKGGAAAALSGFAGAVCIGAPLAATLSYALPMSLLQSAAARCGAVVPGPSAVESLRAANTVLLRARDLFPAGSVRLHGIKTFEKERIDIAILYAASLLVPRCETLRGVFLGMVDNNEKLLEKVENASEEIGCGFIGWIGQSRVVLGSREMMKRHGIEVPSSDYEARYTKNGERSAIYLAVAGRLFGMFLVSYQPSRRVADAVKRLASQDVRILVQTNDFNITAPLVAHAYEIEEGSVKVLSQVECDALETELSYKPESEGAMIHTGSCASLLGGLHAAQRFDMCEQFACVALLISCLLGALVSVAMSFYQGLSGLSIGVVVLYQLLWCAVVSAAPLLKRP